MNEQSPDQERQIKGAKHYECPRCGQTVKSTYTNGLYVTYAKQPWMNHFRVACKEDGFIGMWWEDQNNLTEAFLDQFITWEQEYCDDPDILEVRRQSLGIEKDVAPKEISQRAETFVQKWGEFLQATVVDVSDFGGDDA